MPNKVEIYSLRVLEDVVAATPPPPPPAAATAVVVAILIEKGVILDVDFEKGERTFSLRKCSRIGLRK